MTNIKEGLFLFAKERKGEWRRGEKERGKGWKGGGKKGEGRGKELKEVQRGRNKNTYTLNDF